MVGNLIDRVLWLYWRLNRSFMAAFAVALIGRSQGPLDPDGYAIIDKLNSLLQLMTGAVFRQAVASTLLLPLWVPKRQPSAAWTRFLLKIWGPIASHFCRIPFLMATPAQRAARLDTIFRRLSEQAAAEEDDLFKAIIILGLIKTLLTASYLDLDSTWQGLGYLPFTQRAWNPPSGPDLVHPPPTPNSQLVARSVRAARDFAAPPPQGRRRYLVIGSGAGGATAAYFVAKEDPEAEVVVLEAGPLRTNDQLPQHLMSAAATIYMNGAVTLSANQKYTFVQARCVAGGTLVNNSVALKPVGQWWTGMKDRWSWLGADLDWDRLNKSYDELMSLTSVGPANPLGKGFASIGLAPKLVTCNLHECVGCGRCNAGCQYGAKQSMLETTLPRLVKAGGYIVPHAHATELILEGPQGRQVCRGAWVRADHGETFAIPADKVLLATGAFASTKLLRRSGFSGANPGVRTVGRRFSSNMGTPVFGEFDDRLDGWRGLQVGYFVEMPEERTIIETAFAPPPGLGLQAPQWGQRFMDTVNRFSQLAVACPVIGTSAFGDIRQDDSPSGFSIYFDMNDEDWYRLAVGMKHSAEGLFAAGAKRVYSTRFDALEITRPNDIPAYFAGTGPLQYLKVTTAHLQGGNVIHGDANQGVVDCDMKVHGIDRLWITDASVIPAAITLNVQLTIMALARYAVPGIVAAA
jgi:ferredoxin